MALTREKDAHWKKWIGLYNEKMLSKGNFLNLYVYGYDSPDAYAIEKDGKMYYAFFAPKENLLFKGEIELRGLKPGFYTVVDYVDGKDLGVLGVDGKKTPTKTIEFKDHLLLELTKKSL